MARCALAFGHPDLFGSVSVQSAALITESPRELNADLQNGGLPVNYLAMYLVIRSMLRIGSKTTRSSWHAGQNPDQDAGHLHQLRAAR